MEKRRTCGRWLIVKGHRYCCPYDKGHDGECEPHKRKRQEDRRAELEGLIADHGLDETQCEPCAESQRAAEQGRPAGEVVALRCDWSRGLVRALHEAYGGTMPEPEPEPEPEERW